MPNRLAGASSPYLRQHADNPVDWWQWGDAAFADARRRDVPVLLSVGYAACHWCHVMAHESFADAATAALMNERFVSIKVDREERPDIDAVYMAATQALTGGGGWPMTVFLDHDQRAFYAGTYFPPEERFGMPSFTDVLLGVDRAWRTDRDRVLAAAAQIDAALRPVHQAGSGPAAPAQFSVSDVIAAVDRLAAEFDGARGGFGGAPKFPPSMVLEFLLRADALVRRVGQSDGRALEMAAATMQAMARGGMYDQVSGGFARYSVDADWVVPHFEKMLYDNALLLRAYVHWWRATRDELAERVARETAHFLLGEMGTPEGGFASSLDADSEGREGAHYVWTPAQLAEALGPEDGPWAARLCQVTWAGSFDEGASVLQMRDDPDDPERWRRCRERLFQVRARRPRPARDDKVVAAWNGLAIAALAEAGGLLDEPGWVAAAARCADLLLTLHWDPGTRHLARVSLARAVNPEAPGVLEDYADLAEGLLALYQVTGRELWHSTAQEMLSAILERFPDARGGFYDTAVDAPRLIRRPQDQGDGVTPSGSSAAASALLTGAALSGSMDHRAAAERALSALLPTARISPRFSGWAWAAITAALAGPMQVGVVLPRTAAGRSDGPSQVPGLVDRGLEAPDPDERGFAPRALHPLHLTGLRSTSPGLVVAVAREGASAVGLLLDRPAIGGLPTAYPCRGFVCDLPVTDPGALRLCLGDRDPP